MSANPELEIKSFSIRREVGNTKSAERLPIIEKFLQRPELKKLSPLERHVTEQAMGQFLLKGEIDPAALSTSAQQNTQRIKLIEHGDIYAHDEDGLNQGIKTAISNLGEKGLLVFNEEKDTYSLGQESNPQNKGSLH